MSMFKSLCDAISTTGGNAEGNFENEDLLIPGGFSADQRHLGEEPRTTSLDPS